LLGSGQRDIIADFVQGQDKIDLNFIDARTNLAGNQEFSFIGTFNFGGDGESSPEVRFFQDVANQNTIVHVDRAGDGNLIADFEIQLSGLFNLNASDFNL
ncbi:MAG: M10 family metallopeptidase C-terminal domain-containing protein, partial [Hyphomicrobium sp.]